MKLYEQLNIEWVKMTPTEGVMHTLVVDEMTQPNGILHGGISAYLAEHCANYAAITGFDPAEAHPVGLNLESTHLLPVYPGDTIETRAHMVHGGGRTQVWAVEQVRLSDGETFNVSQLTVYIKRFKKDAAK
jgi:uncharacterized protein (TIGR00369 family)